MSVDCLAHDWTVRAIELSRDGVWTEEVCRRCGDERAVRPARDQPSAPLVALIAQHA